MIDKHDFVGITLVVMGVALFMALSIGYNQGYNKCLDDAFAEKVKSWP